MIRNEKIIRERFNLRWASDCWTIWSQMNESFLNEMFQNKMNRSRAIWSKMMKSFPNDLKKRVNWLFYDLVVFMRNPWLFHGFHDPEDLPCKNKPG